MRLGQQPFSRRSPTDRRLNLPHHADPRFPTELALGIVVQSAEVKLSPAEARLLRFHMARVTQQLQVTAAQLTFALVFLRRVYVASPTTFVGFVTDGVPEEERAKLVHRCLVFLFTAVGVARKCLHDTSRRRLGQWIRHVAQHLEVPVTELVETEMRLLFAVQFRLHVPAATFDAWVEFLENKVLQIETARQQAVRVQRLEQQCATEAAVSSSEPFKPFVASPPAAPGVHARDSPDTDSYVFCFCFFLKSPRVRARLGTALTSNCGPGCRGWDRGVLCRISKRRRFSITNPLAVGGPQLSLQALADSLKSPTPAAAAAAATTASGVNGSELIGAGPNARPLSAPTLAVPAQ